MGIDNNVDWVVVSTPQGERLAPSLSAKRQPARTPPTTKDGVMDTLLGQSDLAAQDTAGRDPYNATGKIFRR